MVVIFVLLFPVFLFYKKNNIHERIILPRPYLNSNLIFTIHENIKLIAVTVSVIYVIKFYTGMSVIQVFNNYSLGISNYLQYQEYFANSGLSDFSISKIIPIIIGVYIKLNLIVAIEYVSLKWRSEKIWIDLSNFGIILTYLFYSFARGTNFELLEIFLIFIYFFSLKQSIRKLIFSKIQYILGFFAIVFCLIAYFLHSVNLRAIISCYTEDLCVDTTAILYAVDKDLAYLSFVLSGYFTYGIRFIGFFFINFFEGKISCSFLYPSIFRDESVSNVVCSAIDCGVNWQPDFMSLVNFFGILLAVPFSFGLMFFSSKIHAFVSSDSGLAHKILGYFGFLYMFSLPIGQFISSSSSNLILLILSFLLFTFSKLSLR
jgi:hypothetical protein